MNTQGLSLNTIPPLLTPLRFFLTAPLFAILGAFLILISGPEIWTSRWLPESLALTHLLTIGFMLMVMFGALYQFVPVMLGQLIPGSERLAPVIHILLIFGTLFLAGAFLMQFTMLYWFSLLALGLAVLLFALSLLPLLIAQLKKHLIVFILRLLFLVLLITIGLGLYMLLAYASPGFDSGFRGYTDVHATWGLTGWVVLLIMAVSSQVIPMFFVTPEFSVRYLKVNSLLIIITLSVLFIVDNHFQHYQTIILLLKLLFSVELVFVAFYILFLANKRKRKLPDVTINFFYLSLLSLIAGVLLWWVYHFSYALQINTWQIQFEFSIALLLIYGLALSAIIGMLQKIVPFLIYLNLQQLSFKRPQSMMSEPKLVPNMKQVITSRQSKLQFNLHCISYALLILSVYYPPMTRPAAAVMLCNFIWLSFCLYHSFILYRENKKKILTFAEMKMDFSI